MPASLEYRTPGARKPFSFKVGYRLALGCALLPMIVGTLVFAGWYWTGDEAFMFLSLLTIAGGLIFFLAGIVFLVLYTVGEIGLSRRLVGRVLLTLFLLLANFPLAAFYMNFAEENGIVVEITNRGSQTLRQVQLVAPHERTIPVGDIAPGQTVRARAGASGDGELAAQWNDNAGKSRHLTIEGYVTGAQTGRYRVDIHDGSETVSQVK